MMDKNWYKEFVQLFSQKVKYMDKQRRKELGYKRLDEIADVDIHAEVHFDDTEEKVLILYFRDDHFIDGQVVDYDHFIDICTD